MKDSCKGKRTVSRVREVRGTDIVQKAICFLMALSICCTLDPNSSFLVSRTTTITPNESEFKVLIKKQLADWLHCYGKNYGSLYKILSV